jgi:UDP:flavonoid glycosyltransferase YjiC (YdhE family)
VTACGVMRVLFSTTAGTGHFGPLIPVARVCQAAGHTVAVAAPARFAEAVTGAAFDHLPFADPSPELRGKVFNRAPQLTFEEMNRLVLAEVFARLDAQAALPTLSEIMIDWRPDLVVREPCEFGSLVAAESVGIPQLQVAIMTGRIGPGILGVVRESLAELSTMAGLLPERAAGVLLQADSLTSVPEALDSGDLMLGGAEAEEAVSDRGRMWRFRTDTPVKPRLPATWGDPADPLIYVSYGSVTARQPEFAPIYDATLRTLADLPARVLMTTGRGFDVGELEPIPPNTHVEQWWPQEAVMGAAAAVVGHGGFGTTMAAVAAGVPQVVVPLFAFDQSVHARRVAEVNAGIQLTGGVAAVADIPAALRRVLDEPAFAEGARAMAAEIAALPDIAECLPLLEQLASSRVSADA